MPKPNFFIVGAPKCGTTSLSQWLAGHANIFMSSPKEPHFFNTDEAFRNVTDLDQYLGLFADAGADQTAIGEASTWYLHSSTAIANIQRFAPNARFIVCLRNPVDMAYSLYGHFLLTGREHIPRFEDAWAAAPERAAGRQLGPWVTEPRYLDYPHACALGTQLQRMMAVVPREKIHIVVLDDMRLAPQGVYQSCLAFLELNDDGRCEFPVHNSRQPLRSVRLHRLMLRLRSLRQSLGLSQIGQGWGAKLSRKPKSTAESAQLSPEFRTQLSEYFRDEISLLWSLCGRAYPEWLSPSQQKGSV